MRALRTNTIARYFAPTLTVAVVLWLALAAAITITGRWS